MAGPESQGPQGPKKDEQKLVSFVKENLWESISYVIMFAGLILSIFDPFFGRLPCGIDLGHLLF